MKPAILVALPLISLGLLAGCGKSSNVQAAAPIQPGQATLIRTQAVQPQLLSDMLELSAKVQADPARLVHVFPPAGGRVTAIEVRPGDRVRQGQTVAVLQSSDIASARADYEKARIESERSDRDLKRASLLFEHEVMPEKDYLDAKAGAQTAHAELARTRQRLGMLGVPVEGSSDQLRVTAPRPGIVLDLGAAPGELNKALDAQQPLLTIADLSHVWIVADVYEKDLATVRPGAAVEVRVNAYPGRVWSGRIDSVSGALDPATRTVKARIVLPNADLLLKPEMFATIRMSGGSHNAIQLPAAAVIREGTNSFVFVRNSSGQYENRKVSLGAAFRDRQEVLNRLQGVNLPANLSPQLSPWSPVGEIYRFWLDGPGYSMNELKATADWLVRREIKQVPGIVDLTVFGGTTRQYQAEIDPRRLLQYNVTLPQVVQSVQNANANAGGNYLSLGQQNVNVRGIGLIKTTDEMGSVVITSRNGAPVLLRDVAQVHEGNQPRLGQIGVNNRNDIVEGITLLQRGEESLPALAQLHQKIKELNTRLLPPGMKIRTLYDRADLIHITTSTVRHVIILGLVLVTLLLLVFLGDVRMSLITALTIPLSVIFAFGMMVLTGHSANLISIGAIDFGILVDASVIVLEHVFRSLQARSEEESVFDVVARAAGESARPVLFSTLIIVVAFIPLFTMEGVPGRIFAPMSMTYGFALAGALLFALLIAPVLATWGADGARERKSEVRLVAWLEKHYSRKLEWVLANRRKVLIAALGALAVVLVCLPFIGGEFMPKLEEGNLWVRATLPPDVSFDYASSLANRIRQDLRGFPETTQVISQIGRPDDGTDATAFNNLEFSVSLKPPDQWPGHLSKRELIHQMNQTLSKYPGVDFNFSQNIQDNVEEAMSGVKGENSLKLFGDDIDTLTSKAGEIEQVMSRVPGVADLGVFDVKGQPNLLISIDRAAAARYGLTSSDLNAAVQAAIGGLAATQVLDGDRHFDFVVRYQPELRQDPDAIRNILLPTPDGGRVPLGQVANVTFNNGAFMIYRENDRRYIPIKFSVRGRDLSTTMQDIQQRLDREIHLHSGYHFEWAGEYDSLVKEEHRLLVVIPVSLAIILSLLYMNFNSWSDAALILAMLPFGAIGGLLGLLVTRTPFSISAAVGFTSALGVGTLGGLVFLNAIRRVQRAGEPLHLAIRSGAAEEMRPVIMACLAAGLGLLPAAVSSGIGVQAQQPLARVVVGAMVTTIPAVLFLLPVLASFGHSIMQEGAECAAEPQGVAG